MYVAVHGHLLSLPDPIEEVGDHTKQVALIVLAVPFHTLVDEEAVRPYGAAGLRPPRWVLGGS